MTGERLCYILFCIVTEKPEMQSVSGFVCIWIKHKGSFDVQPSNKNSTFTVWGYLLQLVDLTCCCCRGQPADEQCWPPLHNILTQNRTAPIKTDRKINCQCFLDFNFVSSFKLFIAYLKEWNKSAHLNLWISFNNTGVRHWNTNVHIPFIFSNRQRICVPLRANIE